MPETTSCGDKRNVPGAAEGAFVFEEKREEGRIQRVGTRLMSGLSPWARRTATRPDLHLSSLAYTTETGQNVARTGFVAGK